MTDTRERKIKHQMEALDENTKSKALFAATDYTICMRGGSTSVPEVRSQNSCSALMTKAQ